MANNIIEFKGNNQTLFYEVLLTGKEPTDTKIIVPPTHTLLFIKDGKLQNALEEGIYEIYDKTKGFWIFKQKVKDWSSLKAVYISKTAKVRIYWGTNENNIIKYVDSKLGYPIDLRCFGHLEVKVLDAKKFYLEIVASGGEDTADDEDVESDKYAGHNEIYSKDKLTNRIRDKVVSIIASAIESKIRQEKLSYFNLSSHKDQLQKQLLEDLKPVFEDDYGFSLCDFLIVNFNLSDEDESVLKEKYKDIVRKESQIEEYREKRAFEQEVKKDKQTDIVEELEFRKNISADEDLLYQQQKQREREELEYSIKIKREEEDRAWAREDKKRADEKEIELSRQYHDTVSNVGWNNVAGQPKSAHVAFCSKCGNGLERGDVFCAYCGEPTKNHDQTESCPKCGHLVSINAAFCPKCGFKIKEKISINITRDGR